MAVAEPRSRVPEERAPTDAETVGPETADRAAAAGGAGVIHGASVTLIVADLARTIEFYRDKLGFRLLDSDADSAVLAYGQTRLAVRCVPDMPRVDRRLVQLNLEVDDVEAAYTTLRAKGVRFIHPPRLVVNGEHIQVWAAMLRDPDSHGIALIKWRER
ncbi:MAG: VOC family protein [Dactylosporangium sp.]|nr:VOC family protein [Dactylosporangium sp.]